MSGLLVRGEHGASIPERTDLVRLAKSAKDTVETFRANETHFHLSTEDQETPLQSLSVWASDLTSPLIARELMGATKASYRIALVLNVDDIRKLRVEESVLNVVWDHDERPGAQGHCGIVGLKRPPGGISVHYRALRARLAQLAQVSILPELSP
jgi:hypothetical protein